MNKEILGPLCNIILIQIDSHCCCMLNSDMHIVIFCLNRIMSTSSSHAMSNSNSITSDLYRPLNSMDPGWKYGRLTNKNDPNAVKCLLCDTQMHLYRHLVLLRLMFYLYLFVFCCDFDLWHLCLLDCYEIYVCIMLFVCYDIFVLCCLYAVICLYLCLFYVL